MNTPLILHCNLIYMPPNMHASIFYRIQSSSTVHRHQASLIPEFGSHTPSALDPTTGGNVSIILHCNPILHGPKHACKHIYRIQHSSTFHCHQPSLIPEFGSHTSFCSRGNVSMNTPLQPNLHAPKHACKHFLQNPKQFHRSSTSSESNPRVWKPHPFCSRSHNWRECFYNTPLQSNFTWPQTCM